MVSSIDFWNFTATCNKKAPPVKWEILTQKIEKALLVGKITSNRMWQTINSPMMRRVRFIQHFFVTNSTFQGYLCVVGNSPFFAT